MLHGPIMQTLRAVPSGRVLDVGARDCQIARSFVELGYAVDAVDPAPEPPADQRKGVVYHRTRLEDFVPAQHYDLVIASLVSHLVSYDTRTFLARLASLLNQGGLIYVTLLGDEDEWAANPPCTRNPF